MRSALTPFLVEEAEKLRVAPAGEKPGPPQRVRACRITVTPAASTGDSWQLVSRRHVTFDGAFSSAPSVWLGLREIDARQFQRARRRNHPRPGPPGRGHSDRLEFYPGLEVRGCLERRRHRRRYPDERGPRLDGLDGLFRRSAVGRYRLRFDPALVGKHPEAISLRARLDKGIITPASVLDDLPRGSAAITNADKSYLGPLLPRSALSNSRNIPAVDVLEKVGIEEAFDLLGASELHDGRQSARHYGLGLAIGALPVTLEHLVSAYTVLAGDGRYRELVWYRGQPTRDPRQVLSEDAARQVTLFLSDPMARLPTFPRMGFNEYPFPVAVKTGTSSNYRDAWTVAYSSKFVVGVWVGRADYRPMSRMTGYGAASQLPEHKKT